VATKLVFECSMVGKMAWLRFMATATYIVPEEYWGWAFCVMNSGAVANVDVIIQEAGPIEQRVV
jgi:hypothetical protein